MLAFTKCQYGVTESSIGMDLRSVIVHDTGTFGQVKLRILDQGSVGKDAVPTCATYAIPDRPWHKSRRQGLFGTQVHHGS